MKHVSIVLLAIALCSCKSEAPPTSEAAAKRATVEFHEVTDVKQVMNWILDPNSDVIWECRRYDHH